MGEHNSKMNRYNWLCVLYVTFGAVFYGYDSACTTSVLGYTSFLEYFSLDSTTIGAMGSAYYAGAVVGMASNWYLPNKYGRIRTIQIGCLASLLAAAMQTGAHSYGVFVAGRVIGGFASGLIFVVCPAYASEIAPPKMRGRIGGLYSYAAFKFINGLGFYFIKGNVSWRLLLGCQLIPGTLMFACSFLMPESPRFLAYVGRYDEALAILKKMHGTTHDDTFYIREFHQIKAQIELDREERLGLKAIWQRPSYRKRFLLVFWYAIACMLSGVIVIQNYQVILYTNVGFSNVMSLILTGVWGCVGTLSAIYAALCFDLMGRRPTMFISYFLIVAGTLTTCITWAIYENGGSTNRSLAKGIIAAMFFVGLGYGGPANAFLATYPAEIMPTSVRPVGVAVSYMTQHVLIIILVQFTPQAIETISWKFFLIFVCSSFVFAIVFVLFYPETRNKTLEEIEAVFGDKVAETLDEAAQHIKVEHVDEKAQAQGHVSPVAVHEEGTDKEHTA
ncbi:uncharacterized protein A1O5_12918 [Cladophialophora psammophila CBS 110553]|uniref:Major facilitator superfamily (MFS) profile domain-containing protein n=1 Tax=Cladophialophora psammophila CBS 110553 TaxID=1182543 RepID=W9VGW7_9EURO|nr:uncharacterized protein A1O5_12918 [Cladophialophora psammophila CBS 110553]EXJ54852.1 hypothetical protein A1O5_12918 [Cladophialophora psammophila CBS 110553]